MLFLCILSVSFAIAENETKTLLNYFNEAQSIDWCNFDQIHAVLCFLYSALYADAIAWYKELSEWRVKNSVFFLKIRTICRFLARPSLDTHQLHTQIKENSNSQMKTISGVKDEKSSWIRKK